MNRNIVERTKAPPILPVLESTQLVLWILTNWVARKSTFSALPNAQNGGESEGGAKSGGLKHQFSQVEGDLDL